MSTKRNLFYAISANLTSTLVSAVISLLLPKMVTVESYSFFQYYLFWAGYAGVLHFGWADGIYLLLCGKDYNSLNKGKISSQIKAYTITQMIVSAVIVIVGTLVSADGNYKFVFLSFGILIIVTNIRILLLYILQATTRIREYSIASVCGLLIYLFSVCALMLFGVKSFKPYIAANIASVLLPLIISIYYCKDIVWDKSETYSIREIAEDIQMYLSAGSKLMIANFASSFIIGIMRLMIERKWSIVVFGKISLTITISNMFMTFINAISVVLLPLLRRMDEGKTRPLFKQLNTVLMTLIFGAMIVYYPIERILAFWLPDYADSLSYMAILFPICVFESKNAMINMTYLKAFRKENIIMIINIASLCIATLLSFVSVYCLHSITISMLVIVVILGIRCIIAEVYIAKYMSIQLYKPIIEEVILTVVFIASSWLVKGLGGMLLYTIGYCVYFTINFSNIKNSMSLFRSAK